MPTLVTPQNKKKYLITASEILYDPLSGAVPTSLNIGLNSESSSMYYKDIILSCDNIEEYDFLEIYAVDDDFTQLFTKISNPKVNMQFYCGMPTAGGNYIFMKSSSFKITDLKTIKLTPIPDNWKNEYEAGKSPYGVLAANWGGHLINFTEKTAKADYSKNCICIVKIIGYKNVSVSMD